MNRPAWMILTTGLADGYELTKSPARVKEARENGQTVIELSPKPLDYQHSSVYGNLGHAKTFDELRDDLGINRIETQ